MMKRTLSLLLAFVLLLGLLPVSAFADGTDTTFKLYFETDVTNPSELKINDTITVTAKIQNNPGFAGMKTKLTWDNSVVKFEGFETTYSEDLEADVLVSDFVKTATHNTAAGTVVYGKENDVTKASGTLWVAKFTVIKDGDTKIALSTDGEDFQMANADKVSLLDSITIDQTALKDLVVPVHVHEYTHSVVVTAPTCTKKGYTTRTCACGDSIQDTWVDETGHNYENGVCTVCNAVGTAIPEGAKFLDMITSDNKPVTITDVGDYYKVEVPLGTTKVDVVYTEGSVQNSMGFSVSPMIGFDGVSMDGYQMGTSNGKTTVGLFMEKAPANLAPTTLKLLNVPYGENPRRVGITMTDGTVEYFAFTYQLGAGQYFAALPEGIGYTASGSPVAANGYTFSVTIDEGYEATADFAIKVNGETVAKVPGNVTVASVTEDLIITVAGVQMIVEATDISVTFDLTGYLGAFSGGMNYVTQSYEMVELTPEVNKKNTLTLKASDNMILQAQAYNYSSLVTGWDIDGTIYNIPTEYTRMSLGDGIELALGSDGYFSLNVETTSPYTAVIKPVLVAIPEGNYHVFLPDADDAYTLTAETYATDGYTFSVAISHGYRATDAFAVKVNGETVATVPGTITLDTVSQNLAITVEGIEMLTYTIDSGFPAFVEDIIKVTNIVVEKEDVESYQWDGDTLTVILSDETAQNASITTNWTIYAKNTYDGATGARFKFNGSNKAISGAEGTNAFPVTTTLVDGAATTEITVEPRNTVQTNRDIIFTPKTFTVNFTVASEGGDEPTTYAVNIDQNITCGTVTADPASAAEGATVTLTQEPATGYKFVEFTVTGTDGEIEVNESTNEAGDTVYSFTMPASEVTVSAEFAEKVEIQLNSANIVTDETGKNTLTLMKGATETILPAISGGEGLTITWSSSDVTVATVDENGKITAVGNNAETNKATITATAMPAVSTFTLDESGNPIATIEVTVENLPEGAAYTATISEDVTVDVGETVAISVTVGHADNQTGYNAVDMELRYDNTALELHTKEIDGLTVTPGVGTVRVSGPGTDKEVNTVAFTLEFEALKSSTSNVTLTSAKVDNSGHAIENDAPDATINDNIACVTINGYTVNLPGDFTGDSTVDSGADYTFVPKNKNYDYTVTATMGGEPATVKENEDGSFTIEKVTGNLVITLTEKTGKFFDITLGDDMTDEVDRAQYMTDYTAKLTKADGYTYRIEVKIGGNAYTNFEYNAETGDVIIPGKDITGAIVFNSNKTEATANKVKVEFQGNGAGDANGEMEATVNAEYSFTVNKALGYAYSVSYKMGDSTENVELTEANGKYTIEKVTGNLVITVSKNYDLEVKVTEYLQMNEKTIFLVRADGTLDEGKAFAYAGDAMYFSNVYSMTDENTENAENTEDTTTAEKGVWAYLVIVEKGSSLTVEDAKAQISLIEAETITSLDQNFNVNMSSSKNVDINDAQLVFDMYNSLYDNFNTVTMQKFLYADVNTDTVVNSLDAQMVVYSIVNTVSTN